MTSAKSTAARALSRCAPPGSAEVGIVRSRVPPVVARIGFATEEDERESAYTHTNTYTPAHTHASFLRNVTTSGRRRDAQEPVYQPRLAAAWYPAGCCQEQNTAAGVGSRTGQPASRSFYGIIFSIPTASTVVAYNISRHINIPEGRRAARWLVQSAGERTTRTTCAAATSAQWRSVLVSATPR